MESYVEQCLILMVLQTTHFCFLCRKDCEEGDNPLQFLGLLNVLTGKRKATLKGL